MKLLHISDLHLGKKVNEMSMLADQMHILLEVLDIIKKNSTESVLISGDIYDKPVPSADAVTLFDTFLTCLSQINVKTFIIAGNHDSPERLSFCSQIMSKEQIYIAPVFDGTMKKVELNDEFGLLNVYLLPFVKPATVKNFFPDSEILSTTDAIRTIINAANVDYTKRNILVAHQFVTGAITCDSEDTNVGGANNVDATVFDGFDYVALGHLHNPQNVTNEKICYCGSPIKYSFSEAKYQKYVNIISLFEKNDVEIDKVKLVPLHEMREIKGSYNTLTLLDNYKNTVLDDYIHITLTDEEDIIDAISKLRSIYPNVMKLDYDNTRTRKNNTIDNTNSPQNKTPFEMFSEFYFLQNNSEMSKEQKKYVKKTIDDIWSRDN
ncbi:MAG: exonuclease SbcCD subunit D [Oscillospiraceae bacterium]